MTGLRFVAGLAALPLIGRPFLRFRAFDSLPPAALWGLAGVSGALALCVEMVAATWAGVPWSIGLLLVPPVIAALVPRRRASPGMGGVGGAEASGLPSPPPTAATAVAAVVVVVLVVVYAVATARATAADYVLFWGAKGERFAMARAIDVAFLKDWLHILMHPDYPPMLPCVYAWGALVAGRFAWGAALFLTPLSLALSAATFYGFAQARLGRRRAGEYAAVLAALLGFLMATERVAGDAEPLLFFFEVAGLSALLFARETPAGIPAAALALTAAVLTKIEGTVFAGLVVGAAFCFLAPGKRWRTALALGLPPAAALAGWLLFCDRHGLLDIYRLAGRTAHSLRLLRRVIAEIASAGFLGWNGVAWGVVAVLFFFAGRATRESWSALAVAAGVVVFMAYMYLASPDDPTWFIRYSASRLMITPLIGVFFATAAKAPTVQVTVNK